MRIMNIVIAIMLTAAIGAPAGSKGCLRGAVARHYVGKGHAVAEAAVGCVAARHHYAKQKAVARQRG